MSEACPCPRWALPCVKVWTSLVTRRIPRQTTSGSPSAGGPLGRGPVVVGGPNPQQDRPQSGPHLRVPAGPGTGRQRAWRAGRPGHLLAPPSRPPREEFVLRTPGGSLGRLPSSPHGMQTLAFLCPILLPAPQRHSPLQLKSAITPKGPLLEAAAAVRRGSGAQ